MPKFTITITVTANNLADALAATVFPDGELMPGLHHVHEIAITEDPDD
jgi:hypothetical protein